MLTCSNCGATLREGARFCTACGTRLNEEVVAETTSEWSTASDSAPAGRDRDSSGSDVVATASTPEQDAVASTDSPESDPSSTGEFSWTWGDQVASDSAQEQANDEPGTLGHDHRAPAPDPGGDDDPIVDASELDVLEEDHTTSDEEDAVAVEPNAERSEAPIEDDESEGRESETLAAWAEQWDESADESATSSATTNHEDAVEPDDRSESSSSGAQEETVARAERLLGELRAMMPALINPRPGQSSPSDTSTVADDLESAAKIGHFEDVSAALLAARDNPRDVDNMLSLAGMVDRLLELLDDRNNLAKTAETAASRLRSTDASTLM